MQLAAWMIVASGLAQPPAGAALPPAEPADVITPIIAVLRDPDATVRSHAGGALAAIGPPAVAPLVAALADKDRVMRAGAAYALGQLGLAARPAKDQLLKLLKDEDRDVRRQATYALSRLLMAERDELVSPAAPPAPAPFPAGPAK